MEFEERVDEVLKLVGHARRKYFGDVRGVEPEDMEAEGVYWVYKNAWRYDPEKSSFSTFVCMTAKSGMSMYLRKERERGRTMVDLDAIIDVYGVEQEMGLEEQGVRGVLGQFISKFKGLKREIAEELLTGEERVQIAREKGVSRSYVSKIMCEIGAACREKYEMVDGVIREKEREK